MHCHSLTLRKVYQSLSTTASIGIRPCFPSRMASRMNTSRREKITWQAAKKWIETNSASNYGMQNVHSEQDLLYALKDGKILLRILGYHAQREGKVKDDSLNRRINNR